MNNNLKFDINPQSLRQLKENSTWYLVLGMSMIALGILATIFAYASTIFSVIYFGILLIILGFFEAIKAFKVSLWGSFFLHLFLSILYIICGIFIVSNPAVNAITLTLLLAGFFVVAGISRIIFAFTKHVPHKGWLILNGILTLILGILIWQQWPWSGLWVIGMFVGIDAIFTGFTWIMLSSIANNLVVE